jgi:hypothetical protein
MAAGILPAPGSKLGPCKRCEHRDCAELREMAGSVCRLCDKAIGYSVRYYADPDAAPGQRFYVHARCLEREA